MIISPYCTINMKGNFIRVFGMPFKGLIRHDIIRDTLCLIAGDEGEDCIWLIEETVPEIAGTIILK